MIKVTKIETLITDEEYNGPLLLVQKLSDTSGTVSVSKDFGYKDLIAFFVARDFTLIDKSQSAVLDILVLDINMESCSFDDDGNYLVHITYMVR